MGIFYTQPNNVSDRDLNSLKDELLRIIRSKEGNDVGCVTENNAFHIMNKYWDTEFRFTLLPDRVLVSRIMFRNKRKNTMTECFKLLIQFCKKYNLKGIVIQSVSTPEMVNWCNKNRFTPSIYNMVCDGVLMGDYEYIVR